MRLLCARAQVVEGAQNTDHGVVFCGLCRRHNKSNTFAQDGYRCGCCPASAALRFFFSYAFSPAALRLCMALGCCRPLQRCASELRCCPPLRHCVLSCTRLRRYPSCSTFRCLMPCCLLVQCSDGSASLQLGRSLHKPGLCGMWGYGKHAAGGRMLH
jgi:hypothetical protein